MISKNKSYKKSHIRVCKRITAPKGYSFNVVKMSSGMFTHFYVNLSHNKKIGKEIRKIKIGSIHLAPHWNRPNTLLTHSTLDADYHHKGLGALMYAKAIQFGLENGFKVHSSGGSSDMAQRVWRGHLIRQYFNIRCNTHVKTIAPKWYATVKAA